VQARLSGILRRFDTVRPPFARFYASLKPGQKAQLNAQRSSIFSTQLRKPAIC